MEVDMLREELDEARADIERLRSDLKSKTELSESLRKAHSDQLVQLKEACMKIERQSQELYGASGELSEVKRACDTLQRSLNEKESALRHLAAANDQLRVDSVGKFQKWEEEKRELVLALDQSNEKNGDQDRTIQLLKDEIEGLQKVLSDTKKKFLEAERKSKAPKDGEEIIYKLEEHNKKLEDQLKWKKEQFKHLEEAHEKLRAEFKTSRKEWERELSTLVEKVCSLEVSLDSQTRISEDLQRRLQMCNQALAHEETRRKYLEIELLEYKSRFESVFTECQDTKLQLECMATQRDKEIASLRSSLGNKEMLYREMEYQTRRLEQENQELLESVKELQEARIQELSASSLAKLRNRLRSMEQMQRDSSATFKAKEVEWSSRLENLTRELDNCRSAMDCKEASLKALELELDNYFSEMMNLKLQNEESAVMLLVLKSEITDLALNIMSVRDENVHTERDEKILLLMKELEMKSISLARVSKDVEVERQRAATLVERIDTLEPNEHKLLLQQKELERYKEMLADSSARLMSFKEQALQKETELNDKLRAVCDALDAANSDLAVEHDKAMTLARRVETLDFVEEKKLMLQRELEKYKEMLDESSRHEIQLEQQVLENESVSAQKLQELNEELAAAKSEVAEYCKKATFLSVRIESLVALEEKEILMQEELTRCKEMLQESCTRQHSLSEELRKVCDAWDSANSQLAEERERAESLCQRCESLEKVLEEKQLMMQKEIGFYQEKPKDSSRCQLHVEEQATLKENQYIKKLKEAYDELDKVNSEIATKICESHSVQFELWIWKSIAERLKDELEENHALRKEVEASLLAQVEVGEIIQHEKESVIANLQQKIQLYEQESKTTCSARAADIFCFDSEKERILRTIREKDKLLEDLQEEIGWLEEESLRRELEVAVFVQMRAESTFANEKESIMKLVEEKEQRTADVMQHLASLERRFNNSMISFSSELTRKQSEVMLVHEAWEKIAAAEILTQFEIEEKKLMILDLEDGINSIKQKLEFQAQCTSYKKEQSMKIEADLEEKQLELKELVDDMAMKLKASKDLVGELKAENESLVQDVKNLSCQRENMLGLLTTVSNRISQFSTEDMGLLRTLESIAQTSNNGSSSARIGHYDPSDDAKENSSSRPSPKFEAFVSEERSPFRELN